MACYVPFNNRNLDISFFVFRPTVVYVDDLVESLRQFSFYAESLGCVHSSIFRSIHGNMIIWYGAWMKRTDENRQMLGSTLLSVLSNVQSMAVLIDYCFLDAYAGESRDGSPAAKFFTGDILTMNSATIAADHSKNNIGSYACLALFKDRFHKMNGATAGVCFKSRDLQRLVGLFVWRSLHACYSYVLDTDYRKTVPPYLDGFVIDVKYDVFRVVYVSGDNELKAEMYPQLRITENNPECTHGPTQSSSFTLG